MEKLSPSWVVNWKSMLKKLGRLFYPGESQYEFSTATSLYLCGSYNRFTLCGNAHAYVSKYGGKFLE